MMYMSQDFSVPHKTVTGEPHGISGVWFNGNWEPVSTYLHKSDYVSFPNDQSPWQMVTGIFR